MKTKIIIPFALAFIAVVIVESCADIPKMAKPVKKFNINRYLGTWYEIARFDYRFEKHLDNVVAQYQLNNNGEVSVLNSGYNIKLNKWKSAKGVAKFRGAKNVAALKVGFFGPFYAGYNVIALDDDYQYALVAGKNLHYLWILSREKSIPQEIRKNFLTIAEGIGYDTTKLIWVNQNKTNPYVDEK